MVDKEFKLQKFCIDQSETFYFININKKAKFQIPNLEFLKADGLDKYFKNLKFEKIQQYKNLKVTSINFENVMTKKLKMF